MSTALALSFALQMQVEMAKGGGTGHGTGVFPNLYVALTPLEITILFVSICKRSSWLRMAYQNFASLL